MISCTWPEVKFTRNDYYIIASYEFGAMDWNVLVEESYTRMFHDIRLGLSAPIGVDAHWWQVKILEWLPAGEKVY